MVIAQARLNSGHFAALLQKRAHDVGKRLYTGSLLRGRIALEQAAQRGILRQRNVGLQEAVLGGQLAVLAHGDARETQVAGNASLALPSAQTVDEITQEMHV
jgi:hypothetical protein